MKVVPFKGFKYHDTVGGVTHVDVEVWQVGKRAKVEGFHYELKVRRSGRAELPDKKCRQHEDVIRITFRPRCENVPIGETAVFKRPRGKYIVTLEGQTMGKCIVQTVRQKAHDLIRKITGESFDLPSAKAEVMAWYAAELKRRSKRR